jgi:uncharacterized protein (DUF1800 family)
MRLHSSAAARRPFGQGRPVTLLGAGVMAAGLMAAGMAAAQSGPGPQSGRPPLRVLTEPMPRLQMLPVPATGEISRFLAQASFGPDDTQVSSVLRIGPAAWIDRQFQQPPTSHRAYWETLEATLQAANPPATAGTNGVLESFWKQALTGPDQLRGRTAYAWSQIFVVSAADSAISNQPRALAHWLDMLGTDGLTTYRQLLESVSRHPLMGRYLSHLRNQKADPVTGRVPDENYAREVMQLFSIGLVRLNPDGTPVLVGGQPVETYTPADVSGLAKVFTGWSFACPGFPSNGCFNNGTSGGVSDPDREFKPMLGYPQFHSTEAKSFLGVSIPAQAVADPAASLKVALDALDAHPNVGPFIGRQLIQRLTGSNPSPAYVAAVSAVWANNGAGVRGDLKAVVKAILLHPEARQPFGTAGAGKVREPVLRLSAFLRAYPHVSDSGRFRINVTDNPATQLGQTPLRAPSVFNFYRPGYVAPGSQSAAAALVAPELQLLNETSVAGYVNYMADGLARGFGAFNGTVGGVAFNRFDLQRDWSAEMALATQPEALAASVMERLLHGQRSSALQQEVVAAVSSIAIPVLNASGSNLAAVNTAKRNRVHTALLLVLASPEFLVQK